ncbi:MAG: hypothetical protein R2827_00945 [Bdellovibrionales bacterium]
MPFKGQICENFSDFRPVDNAQYSFDRSCSTIYIAPPEMGEMNFGNPIALSTELDCQRINDRRQSINEKLIDLDNQISRVNANDEQLVLNNDELKRARAAIHQLRRHEIRMKGGLKIIDEKLRQLNAQLQDAQNSLAECQLADHGYCYTYELDRIKREIVEVEADRIDYEFDFMFWLLSEKTLRKCLRSILSFIEMWIPITVILTKSYKANSPGLNRLTNPL